MSLEAATSARRHGRNWSLVDSRVTFSFPASNRKRMVNGQEEIITEFDTLAFPLPAPGGKAMRIARVLALVAATVVSGPAVLAGTEPRQAAVRMESITDSVIDYQARIASGVFASIGVQLQWHDVLKCPPEAIYISFSRDTPANAHPGALAYATPYEGNHIVVFLDRVQDITGRAGGRLLGYTLAHEIAHVLEGVARHSRNGLMKPNGGLMSTTR
jgi:hypothetical protein